MPPLHSSLRILLGTAALLAVASAATIVNPSFEQPTTAVFISNPVDPTGAWTFTGRSGVASTVFFNPPPPNGAQAAFIQQFIDLPSTLSSISQTVSGVALVPSVLSFFIAQRPGFLADPIVVSYGSQDLGTFTPASTAFQMITINFTPSSTSGALTFKSAATSNNDLDTALDQVSFNAVGTAVPEPATPLLVLVGLGSVGVLSRRIRRA